MCPRLGGVHSSSTGGIFLSSDKISTIKITTVSRDEFLNYILGEENFSNLKLGITGETKSIKKDEKVLKKYDAFSK